MIRTINGLPKNYAGKVTCLINDLNDYTVLRNLFILETLGTVADHAKAADIALHVWYSAFIPQQYLAQIRSFCIPFATSPEDDRVVPLGPEAKLEATIGFALRSLCAKLAYHTYEMGDATNELARVRCVVYVAFDCIPY